MKDDHCVIVLFLLHDPLDTAKVLSRTVKHVLLVGSVARPRLDGRAAVVRVHKLGPRVGQHQVLDLLFGVVEDVRVEGRRDREVEHAVGRQVRHLRHGLEVGLAQRLLEVRVEAVVVASCCQVGRRAVGRRVAKGRGRALRVPPAVELLGRLGKHVVELLAVARRDVDGELRVLEADKVRVDADSADKGVVALRGADLEQAAVALPVGDVGQETHVLAREILEGGELEQGLGVVLEDVLQGGHGQGRVARVGAGRLGSGALAGNGRGGQGRAGEARALLRNGVGVGGGALVAAFPGGDGIEGLLLEVVRLVYLQAGNTNGEDFNEEDGKRVPVE